MTFCGEQCIRECLHKCVHCFMMEFARVFWKYSVGNSWKNQKLWEKNQAFVRVISSSNISSIWYFRVKIKVSFDFFQFHCWFSIFYFSFSIFHSPFSIFYFLFKDLRENSINCKTIWKSASIHRCTMCWNRIWWHSLKQCYRLRNSMKQPYWKRQRF